MAVNVTMLPVAKLALQVAPQLISAPPLVTVPDPVPAFVTVRVVAPVLVPERLAVPISDRLKLWMKFESTWNVAAALLLAPPGEGAGE